MKKNKEKLLVFSVYITSFLYFSCSVEPEIYSEILPEEFFLTEDQVTASAVTDNNKIKI